MGLSGCGMQPQVRGASAAGVLEGRPARGQEGRALFGHYGVVHDLDHPQLPSGSVTSGLNLLGVHPRNSPPARAWACGPWPPTAARITRALTRVHARACRLAQPGPAPLPIAQIAFSLQRALLLIFAFCNHIHSSRQRSKDTPQSGSPSHPLRRQPFFFGTFPALCAFLWQFGKMRLCSLFLCRYFEGRGYVSVALPS